MAARIPIAVKVPITAAAVDLPPMENLDLEQLWVLQKKEYSF